jgi:23S rRNA pseudouridine955/2504/2580 synthase
MKLPLHPEVRLLTHHVAGLVALDKPEGLRSHPNDHTVDAGALMPVKYDHSDECYIEPDGKRWFLCNRLDAPTSGIVLLCSNKRLAHAVKEVFRGREVEKIYHAVVKGYPAQGEADWRDRLQTRGKGRLLRTLVHRDGLPSETHMKLLESSPTSPVVSLLQLQPHTGRTHQLRVQAASRHLPVVGDGTYGDFRFNREFAARSGLKRLFLHSSGLRFSVVFEGQKIVFKAKSQLPESFAEALR